MVVGHPQGVVIAVEPMHRSFEGKTRMETGGAWIAVNVTFGFLCGLFEFLKLIRHKGEVAHAIALTASKMNDEPIITLIFLDERLSLASIAFGFAKTTGNSTTRWLSGVEGYRYSQMVLPKSFMKYSVYGAEK